MGKPMLGVESIMLERNVVIMEGGVTLPITNRFDAWGDDIVGEHDERDVVVIVAGNEELGYYTITLESDINGGMVTVH